MVINSFAEFLSIAMVVPFLKILSNPSMILNNLISSYQCIGLKDLRINHEFN